MSHLYSINNEKIIKNSKRKAKDLLKLLKSQNHDITLMQCQNKIAQDMGYQDWFDLHNSIKNIKKSHLYYTDSLKSNFSSLLRYCLMVESQSFIIQARQENSQIKIKYHGEFINYETKENFSYKYINDLCHIVWKAFNITNSNPDFEEAISTSGEYIVNDVNGIKQKLNIRLQSIPAYPNGYDLVFKIIPQYNNKILDKLLSDLGYEEEQISSLKNITSLRVGAFIVGGTRTSGRATTINALLKTINIDNNLQIFNFDNVSNSPQNSVESNEKNKLIRLLYGMKTDPDIITIVNIYDNFSASMIKKSIQSGHQVVSCTTASSALGIIERLMDFGLTTKTLAEPYFLNGLCYQTLVPKVCPHCSNSVEAIFQQKHNTNDYETAACLQLFNILEKKNPEIDISHVRLRNKDGCQHCHYTGSSIKTACAEVVTLNDEMRELIRDNQLKQLYTYWQKMSDNNVVSQNMTGKSVKEHGLLKVIQGKLCPTDFINKFGNIE